MEKDLIEEEILIEDKEFEGLWKARTGIDENSLCGAIETLIFMSEKPISLSRIKKILDPDMPLQVLYEAVQKLMALYERPEHGIRPVEVADGLQFRTKSLYSHHIQNFFSVKTLTLGPSALEVLAIIAYKQPVSRSEIDRIRGVESSHVVRQLLDKRLVKSEGRSETELGRPTLYVTSEDFLELFGLNNLNNLPPEHELLEISSQNSFGKISDIKEIVRSSADSSFVPGAEDLKELDELERTIRGASADTPFTKSLRNEDRPLNPKGEAARRKSAFEIMEEYLLQKEVARSNKEAALSRPFMPVCSPQVISELADEIYNLPELLEDEVEFEMIDLETGKSLSDSTFSFDDNLDPR